MAETTPRVYFGKETREKVLLPDTKDQWVEIRRLTAGDRAKYMNELGKMTRIDSNGQVTADLSQMGMTDKVLFDLSVVGYSVLTEKPDGTIEKLEGYDKGVWETLYERMDPLLAEILTAKIRELNPWLTGGTPEKKTS